jgi:hypothetical protein
VEENKLVMEKATSFDELAQEGIDYFNLIATMKVSQTKFSQLLGEI